VTPPTPQRYGKFVLLRSIGQGDVAETFRARVMAPEGLSREVALKRVLPKFAEDEAFVRAYYVEGATAAKLTHKAIAQVFECDIAGGTCYLATELVEGRDLVALARRASEVGQPLSPLLVAHIGAEAASALHYVHTRKHRDKPLDLVHRDVSPRNIMVTWTGDVKLLDFGLAKAKQHLTTTQAGFVRGKCEYMSPEQVMGAPIDGRSDLFSLGVVLWELLAGRRLFAGDDDYETMRRISNEPAQLLRAANPAVSAKLEQIVDRALQRNPAERVPSAGELERELRRVSANVDGRLLLAETVQELFVDDIRAQIAEQNEEREAFVAIMEAQAKSGTVPSMEVSPPPPPVQAPKAPPVDLEMLSGVMEVPPSHDARAQEPPRPAPRPEPIAAPLHEPDDEPLPAETRSRGPAIVLLFLLLAVAGVLAFLFLGLQ
jgi:serine/threonine-protein kinase